MHGLGSGNPLCYSAASLAARKRALPGAGILPLLTVIWGVLDSFGLPSFSLPPLDLALLPPLAFLGRPMLEAGWCSANSRCRLRPVSASADGVAWMLSLLSWQEALLLQVSRGEMDWADC